jgi:DNA-binding Lrp family transcriptional regulator
METGWSGPERARPRAGMKLDTLDEQIIWELVRDGRISNKALADKLHVSPSTTLLRVRALKEAGVLESAHVKAHLPSVGLPVEALIFVTLVPQAGDAVQRFVKDSAVLANVINTFFVGADQAVIIHVACVSTDQLRDLVTMISRDPVVATTQTQIVFERLDGAQHMDGYAGFEDIRKPVDSEESWAF